jgi:Tol biopolymer transport system component
MIDVSERKVIADVENYDAYMDGQKFRNADFNFWGVTFTPHAKEFFATLSTGGKHYLIKGDIAARRTTVVHENVECPSLSPDATRVAYKKRYMIDGRVVWQLHVLDLATGKETALAEKRSIDDQLEWLDDRNVLYAVASEASGAAASTDVWVAAADGSSQPKMFIANAYSPASVR